MIFIQKRINHTLKTDTRKTILCYIQEGSFNTKKSCWTENIAYIWENDWINEKRRIQQQCVKFRFVYFFSSSIFLRSQHGTRASVCVRTNGCDCMIHTQHSISWEFVGSPERAYSYRVGISESDRFVKTVQNDDWTLKQNQQNQRNQLAAWIIWMLKNPFLFYE